MKNITIKDVAKASGFSLSTVSRVLGNSDYPVSQEAREAIEKTANKMGYISNLLARSLKTAVSKEIAVIMPTITNPFYNSLVSGTGKVLSENGYTMLVSFYEQTSGNNSAFQIARSRMADGIIIASDCITAQNVTRIQQMEEDVPVVFVDYYPNTISRPNGVFFEYYKGGKLVANYLLQKGHSKIAFVTKPLTIPSRISRRDGFFDGMYEAGINDANKNVFIDNKDDFEAGRTLTDSILESPVKYTAIAASNDAMAVGVLSRLAERGIKVPDDISVTGFDDCVFSKMSVPLLTTVKVPAEEMGASAAEMLLKILNKEPQEKIYLAPEIIERNTVKDIN